MDISPQNIKMCEKAEGIRKGYELEEGDYIVSGGVVYTYCPQCVYETWPAAELDKLEKYPHWLPRQDQLQKMINIKDYDFLITSNGVEFFLDILNWHPKRLKIEHINSMEQLWLAFVMKEKYQKTWTGAEWTN